MHLQPIATRIAPNLHQVLEQSLSRVIDSLATLAHSIGACIHSEGVSHAMLDPFVLLESRLQRKGKFGRAHVTHESAYNIRRGNFVET